MVAVVVVVMVVGVVVIFCIVVPVSVVVVDDGVLLEDPSTARASPFHPGPAEGGRPRLGLPPDLGCFSCNHGFRV